MKNSIFGQFLPILATFYEVKITFLKFLKFSDSTCSGASKISNFFSCAHFWVNKSLRRMCVKSARAAAFIREARSNQVRYYYYTRDEKH
jgi:hypothetical protein